MTSGATKIPAPDALLEREIRARAQAEALLEERSRELHALNLRLTAETEAVRAALAETEALRLREAVALKERSILSEALKALTGKSSAAEAMQALLEVLKREFVVSDSYFVQAQDDGLVIRASARAGLVGHVLPLAPSLIERARRMSGIAAQPGIENLASLIIAPLRVPDEDAGAFILGCARTGRFSANDLRVLEQVARLATQALFALREARKNTLLLGLVEGRPPEGPQGVLDAPFEAIYSAFARLTEMQGQVVGILDALLGAPLHAADLAVDDALARMGVLTGVDRVYVFRLRPDGDFIDNTHEWCADGIEPARDILQDIPAHMIDHWRAVFDAGQDVLIPDVAGMPDDAPEKSLLMEQGIRSLLTVPLVNDGKFAGFVGFDAVQGLRSFLPGEVHLIRSIAKVIVSVLARRDAEARLVSVHAETAAQRTRLEAVLSAMPDLIVELDRGGRFVSWHSGTIVVPDHVYAAFVNRTPEETLPPDLAREARRVLAELDAGAAIARHSFQLALIDARERWWQLSASAIGDQGYLFALRDMTEAVEKNAEIERLSQIARRTTNLVVVTDAARRITWVNAAFERTTGWSLAEVRGRKPGDFLQCDQTDPATIAHIRAGLNGLQPVQAEILNRARDGQTYWLSMDIQPLHNADGVLEGYLAVQVDVTERRAQAESLRQAAAEAALARATLETAVEALRDGFVLYDADDRLVICNSRYREIYARSAPAIVPGATFESILRYGLDRGQYPEAKGREADWLRQRLEQHAQSDSEIEQQLADGTWLRVFEKAIPDGGRVGLRVDITALKLAEQRALADRATAMEASLDGISITDADGHFLYMNRAHLEMFGYSDEREVLGRHWSMLYAEAEVAWVMAHAMPELARQGGWSGEIMGLAKDGSVVDQDVSLTLKEDGGLLCISRDITARRSERAERDRLMNELQLAQRREMIGQMAAGLAHDFNNLLAVIAGSATLIIDGSQPDHPTVVGATRVLAASEQAAGLVKRLLTLGARQPARVPLDLRRPVQEAGELVRSSLRAPMRLSISMPEDPVEALADPTDILQVVLNLAINARDALAERPGTITIALAQPDYCTVEGPLVVGHLDPARRYACLSVIDTGPGMPPEVAANILKPYFSTKGDKGTGLGLAVVSSVIGDNGGAMRLETQQGQGTRFDVYWPIDARAEPSRPVTGAVGAGGSLKGRMILVVDDQQDVLDTVVACLEAAGAEVAATTVPAEVLDVLAESANQWDLLVTDYNMPGMTGLDLANAARVIVPDLPVLMVTALPEAARVAGAALDAIVPKPFRPEDLVREAGRVLHARPDRKV